MIVTEMGKRFLIPRELPLQCGPTQSYGCLTTIAYPASLFEDCQAATYSLRSRGRLTELQKHNLRGRRPRVLAIHPLLRPCILSHRRNACSMLREAAAAPEVPTKSDAEPTICAIDTTRLLKQGVAA